MNTLLLAELDFVTILPFALVGAIAVGGFVVLDYFFNRKTRTETRLEELKSRMNGGGGSAGSMDSAKSGISSFLEKASPAMGEALAPKN